MRECKKKITSKGIRKVQTSCFQTVKQNLILIHKYICMGYWKFLRRGYMTKWKKIFLSIVMSGAIYFMQCYHKLLLDMEQGERKREDQK